MADDVFFRLLFAKVEEMEKTFRGNSISDADVLSFCTCLSCLESNLKRNNMQLEPKNYTLSYTLETMV